MPISITLNQLSIFIVFVLILVVGGYAVVTLRNVNNLILSAKATLNKNNDHIDRIIPQIDEISANLAIISKGLVIDMEEAGEAVRTISSKSAETVLTVNALVANLANYTMGIGEIVKALANLFSSDSGEKRL